MGTTAFTSEVTFLEAQFSDVDGPPLIKNVVLLGNQSVDAGGKVKRRYTTECMRNAVPLYEGVRAFVNHPNENELRSGNRDVRDLAGQFVRVRFVESELKIRADFEGLPNDPASAKFINIAKNMPGIAGCSQHAEGRARQENGIQIMESIERVNSVDLVCRPATTASLFESVNKDNDNGDIVMEYKDITSNGLRVERVDLVEEIKQEGIKSRDGEVATLLEEKKTLELKVDAFELKETLQHKHDVVMTVLKESKLPDGAVTELFRNTLLDVSGKTDDEVKTNVTALIEDRMKVIESVKTGGPINVTEKVDGGGAITQTAEQAAAVLKTRS